MLTSSAGTNFIAFIGHPTTPFTPQAATLNQSSLNVAFSFTPTSVGQTLFNAEFYDEKQIWSSKCKQLR